MKNVYLLLHANHQLITTFTVNVAKYCSYNMQDDINCHYLPYF